ncbi:hypothetical protein BDP27DRAFT_1440730 [Rhodocollybia butyracea]|uniref:Uncharacterized protein n=1 Tax=Rhodocollybia butyracea TaxID=206335 RepID=A0A9P5P0G7_9AGAR|nr:hypothetical protein BDP27DRAFT_1440730 [Rhodocollybia butyracea]
MDGPSLMGTVSLDRKCKHFVACTGQGFELFDLERVSALKQFASNERIHLSVPKHTSFTEGDSKVVGGTDRGCADIYNVNTGKLVQRLKYNSGGLIQSVATCETVEHFLVAMASSNERQTSNIILWHKTVWDNVRYFDFWKCIYQLPVFPTSSPASAKYFDQARQSLLFVQPTMTITRVTRMKSQKPSPPPLTSTPQGIVQAPTATHTPLLAADLDTSPNIGGECLEEWWGEAEDEVQVILVKEEAKNYGNDNNQEESIN